MFRGTTAKSVVEVGPSSNPSAQALTRSAFFTPEIRLFAAGRARALRSAAPRSGRTNLVRSASLCKLVLAGGSPIKYSEDSAMTALIPVVSRIISGTPEEAVNAPNWFKDRVKQFGFAEKEDFIAIRQKRRIGVGKGITEHFVTLGVAKELAMVERNEKGRQARRYFIECEKQLKAKKEQPAIQQPAKQLALLDQAPISFKPGTYFLRIHNDGSFHGLAIDEFDFIARCKDLPGQIEKHFNPNDSNELLKVIRVCMDKLEARNRIEQEVK